MAQETALDEKTTTLFKFLAGQAVKAECVACGEVDWVLPIDDESLDAMFLANYHCDRCENDDMGL